MKITTNAIINQTESESILMTHGLKYMNDIV